ncbi:MAG: fibronectin type III domain-containing protein, partial [Patescibacteria group bacterium]|nr:fibronectin type III domain-containing protein [Patescibacteria group bacterium]
ARNHSVKLENLEDNTDYHYQVVIKDKLGNEAKSTDLTFHTPLDTTGPAIKEVKVDQLPMGTDEETASAIISWTTDKPATTQVEYDEGVIGSTYSQKTVPDSSLGMTHTVIIKELTPGTTYRFRLISKDKRGNITNSQNYNFVTPNKEKSVLQLIIRSLEETFSWVKNVGTVFGRMRDRVIGR